MVSKTNMDFQCEKCGCTKLAIQKYVKCTIPVVIDENGHLRYERSAIDEDDYLLTQNGFCCLDCGDAIWHCGQPIDTEEKLLSYLALDPAERARQEKEFDDRFGGRPIEDDREKWSEIYQEGGK